jgi:isopenicillin N synthase-like dioxygenase
MTLLHQDSTGGLEVVNAAGEWIPVPYIPGSVVVNIGDLMSRVSSGRYVATLHRVRAGQSTANKGDRSRGRYSVPFFLEPGAGCVVRSVDNNDKGVVYGKHLLDKLSKWLEFQEEDEEPEWGIEAQGVMIEAF